MTYLRDISIRIDKCCKEIQKESKKIELYHKMPLVLDYETKEQYQEAKKIVLDKNKKIRRRRNSIIPRITRKYNVSEKHIRKILGNIN